MLNAEKDVKTKETETKKVLEATEKVRKKTEKEPKEVSKRNKILYGFEGGLKKMISTIFPICRMLPCVNTSISIFRRVL